MWRKKGNEQDQNDKSPWTMQNRGSTNLTQKEKLNSSFLLLVNCCSGQDQRHTDKKNDVHPQIKTGNPQVEEET